MTRARDVANLIGSGNFSSTTFTATAGQTAFTISHTQGFVQVFMNGLLLDETVDYTSNGTAITLTSGAAAGDEIEVVAYNTFSVGDAIPASGGTFTGAVTASNGLTVDDAGATPLTVDRASSFGTIIDVQKDGSSVGAVGSPWNGELYIQGTGANSSGLLFTSGNTIQPRKNSAADDGNIDIGASGNKFKDLYLSGGAYIGGTGAANKLDDYEEGTFTPAIAGTTNTPGFWNNTGKYTKIGNMVMIQYFTQLSHSPAPTFSNNAAALVITGLPFTVVGSGYTGSQGVMNSQAFGWNGSLNTQSVSGQVSASAVDSNTQIRFQVTGNTSTRGEVTNQALVNQAAIIEVTLFYRTA